MSEVQGAPGPGATRGILEAAVDAYAEHGGLLRAVDEAARHDARSRPPTGPSSTPSRP
jgi:hypothetical protein